MNRFCSLILATLVVAAVPTAWAQSPADAPELTAQEINDARKKRLMPKPLEAIECNIRDLEEEGFLTIVSGSYQLINNGQDNAIVWSVRANRSLTCRYIVTQLNELSDVRLFKTLRADTNNPSLQEVHSLKLFYSASLEERAANSTLFARDDLFDIWIYLEPVDVRKIRSLLADRAIFRAPKRR